MSWGFYGRHTELARLAEILGRKRWFFARISGRRRIGKTTLIQHALRAAGVDRVLYVQIPDSAPAGVLSAFADALETFGVGPDVCAPPTTLRGLAQAIGRLAEAGYIVSLDEFQYFNRKVLYEFTSHLQATVDDLSRRAEEVPGGVFVLGSIHTELVALLEDRRAPLYNRTTDHIELGHLDIASVLEILRRHASTDPETLLFLWSLFEGVPKFYRDCYEQGVLGAQRPVLLQRMFFNSSSPLRTEADNWFLGELRGRYDVVLKYVARHPGCTNGDIKSHVRAISADTPEQVGGYLKVLIDKYQMIGKDQPIFAKRTARRGRYYIRDNFLQSWLGAIASPVSAVNFRPEGELVARADTRLREVEGHALERLVAGLYEERSRKGLPGFSLTKRIEGFWDRNDTEIDLIALDEEARVIRFGTCKRSASRLVGDLARFDGHIDRFLAAHRKYAAWTVERVAIGPSMGDEVRQAVRARGYLPQDLTDLTRGL